MKVLQIIDSLDFGGMEKLSVNFSNALSRKNINNMLMVTRKAGPLKQKLNDSTQYVGLKKKSSLDFITFFKVYKYVKAYQPTVIHAHATSIYWGILLKLLIPNTTLIYHEHFGGLISAPDTRLSLLRFFAKQLSGCIVVNDDLKVFFQQFFKGKVKVAYFENFVTDETFNKVPSKDYRFLCIANFKKPKNHFDLVRAFKIVVSKEKSCRLTLVGRIDDKEYYHELLKLIDDLSLKDFIALKAPEVDLVPFYENSDFGILISDAEGLPMSILEFGINKIPVIVSEVGQCPKVLENGRLGRIVKIHDIESIADNMLNSFQDVEKTENQVDKFYRKVINNHSDYGFLRSYFNFLNTLA